MKTNVQAFSISDTYTTSSNFLSIVSAYFPLIRGRAANKKHLQIFLWIIKKYMHLLLSKKKDTIKSHEFLLLNILWFPQWRSPWTEPLGCGIFTGFLLYKGNPDELQTHRIQPTANGHSGLTRVSTAKHGGTAFSTWGCPSIASAKQWLGAF